jgi:hypothetical protein
VYLIIALLQNSVILAPLIRAHALSAALRAATMGAALCLALASISLPRRPDVYFRDRLVDRMMTASAYQRFTFDWCGNVLETAQRKQDMDVADLSRPGHALRAADKVATWNGQRSGRPVWRSLISEYKWTLIVQWSLAIAASVLSYLPHWCTYKILTALENRPPGASLDGQVWFYVIGLGAATLAATV